MRYGILFMLLATVGCSKTNTECSTRCEELLPAVEALPAAPAPLEAVGHGTTHLTRRFATRDVDAVLATVIGEVRGQEDDAEVAAVVHVIVNRLRRRSWGPTLSAVVHFHVDDVHAFSCWNDDDPSYGLVTTPGVGHMRKFERLRTITMYVLLGRSNGILKDPTFGATHYFHPKSMVPVNSFPSWASKYERRIKIGEAWFYRLS